MIVGLGTGSTAAFAIRKLGERIKGGLKIHGVPSSRWAENLAKEVGIPLLDFSQTTQIDMTLDGADEFDPALNLIKGGGGALFREKIVAAASRRLVIFADGSKRVPVLGKFPLPVEVNPYGWQVAARKLGDLCPKVTLRQKDGKPFVTDNQGYILDCAMDAIPNPPDMEARIRRITGVMECGLFCGMADTVALANGESVELVKRKG
jgi:ribose 5-phosphate isomerase A